MINPDDSESASDDTILIEFISRPAPLTPEIRHRPSIRPMWMEDRDRPLSPPEKPGDADFDDYYFFDNPQ